MKKIAVLLILIFNTAVFGQACQSIVSTVQGGYSDYFNPYIVYSNVFRWRVDCGANGGTIKTEIHPALHRTCSTVFEENVSFQNAQGKIFSIIGYTGMYYLKTTVGENATPYMYFFLMVPPIKSYTLPYVPPAGNRVPIITTHIENRVSGDGSYGNPIVINNSEVRFNFAGTVDPDAGDDLVYGVMYWAIYTKGWHPKYSSVTDDVMDARDSYKKYNEWHGVTFSWDTAERPSTDKRYELRAVFVDQWGQYSQSEFFFYYDPVSGEEPLPPLLPQPGNLKIVK